MRFVMEFHIKEEINESTSEESTLPIEFVNVKCELPDVEDNLDFKEDPLNINWEVKLKKEMVHSEIEIKEEIQDESESTSAEEPLYKVLSTSNQHPCCISQETSELSHDLLRKGIPQTRDTCQDDSWFTTKSQSFKEHFDNDLSLDDCKRKKNIDEMSKNDEFKKRRKRELFNDRMHRYRVKKRMMALKTPTISIDEKTKHQK